MMNAELIGGIGASLTTIAYLPQVFKIFKTKDTTAISLMMFLMMNIGVTFWLIYGLMIHQQPVIWANLVTLCLAGYIFYVKLRNVIKHKEKV
jgi:MtN3 and saliva related transmembrane protein